MYKVIGVDQKIYGPVSGDQIRQWLAEGRLNAGSLAQLEGASDWKPLSMFAEFIPPPIITPPPAAHPVADTASGLATAGLVFGIAANLCCCFGFIFAIIGLVLSLVALHRMEGQPHHGGRAIAWAGVGLSLFALFWSFVLPFFGGLGPGIFWRRRWRWRYL